jgi:hypothetical protein
MADIGQALPRFESYQNLLPQTQSLNEALIGVYEAVVEFCIETIKVLRRHPMSKIKSSWVGRTAVG